MYINVKEAEASSVATLVDGRRYLILRRMEDEFNSYGLAVEITDELLEQLKGL